MVYGKPYLETIYDNKEAQQKVRRDARNESLLIVDLRQSRLERLNETQCHVSRLRVQEQRQINMQCLIHHNSTVLDHSRQ